MPTESKEPQDQYSTETLFNLAVAFVQESMGKRYYEGNSRELTNDEKLKVYAFYKQATIGTCKENGGERPGFFSLTAKYKWDAWDALGDMSKEDAMLGYVKTINGLSEQEDKHWFDCPELDAHKTKHGKK
eukprot:gene3109-5279_t